MDLESFIGETLKQIVAGVSQAQDGQAASLVNAASGANLSGGNLLDQGRYGVFTRVDFDVAVTAETSGGGKASIQVWSTGTESGTEGEPQTVSRVSFSVPIRLPDGDRSQKLEAQKAEAEQTARIRKFNRDAGPALA